jgi:LysM repeat protein
MKKLIILFFFMPMVAAAQTTHTVAPKETLYSLARKYNIHPKDLAAYNNIPVETGLTIGQVIKIPPKGIQQPFPKQATAKTEPVMKNTNAANSTGVPIYHKVEKKETLYHISKLYNNVTVEDIKKWNNLTGDAVAEGTNLIVGYQAAKKTETTTASKPVKENTGTKTVVADPVKQNPVADEMRPVLPVKNEAPKQEVNKVTGKNVNGGYFKTMFNETTSVKEEKGTAAVFKSTSGWEDGKYYCLHNTAPAGSIIKITNKSTQRTVYAKVLDVIPDLKQNAGILIRLSNAAADELGAGENNFEAILNY